MTGQATTETLPKYYYMALTNYTTRKNLRITMCDCKYQLNINPEALELYLFYKHDISQLFSVIHGYGYRLPGTSLYTCGIADFIMMQSS